MNLDTNLVENLKSKNEEEIFPDVTVTVTEARFVSIKYKQFLKQKVVKFLIHDLFCSVYDSDLKLFTFSTFTFKNVAIIGEVVSKNSYKNKYILEVEDGSARIRVFTMENDTVGPVIHLMEAIEMIENDIHVSADFCQMNQEMLWTRNKMSKNHWPSSKDLQLGDVLYILGSLSEYNGTRNVFAIRLFKIGKDSVDVRCNWIIERISEYASNTSTIMHKSNLLK